LNQQVVIIPTFNEIENIESIINSVFKLSTPFDILIVDDNSPDGTADKVIELQSAFTERLHLLQRKNKKGLGTAYIDGFKYALDHHYDYIFEMDADFSHNPNDLERLLAELKNGTDLIIGSRYVQGGGFRNWGLDRKILSKGASYYVKLITWMPINDATAGFVGYNAGVLRNINLDSIEFVGYAFQIEMKYAAYVNEFKLKEIPITFKDREKGQSKMNLSIISEALGGVLKMRWKSFRNQYTKTDKA